MPPRPISGEKVKAGEVRGKEGFAFVHVNAVKFGLLQTNDMRVRDGDGVPDSIALVLATQVTDIPGYDGVDEVVLIHR
jgi:hypothetical protein